MANMHERSGTSVPEPDAQPFLTHVTGYIDGMAAQREDSLHLGNRANSWNMRLTIAAAFLAAAATFVSALVAIKKDQGLLDSPVLAALLSAGATLAVTIPASGKLPERARHHFDTARISKECGSRAQTLQGRVQDKTLDIKTAWTEFEAVKSDCNDKLPAPV